MDDPGEPISYLVLAKGTPLLSSDGQEIGRVAHVLADSGEDVFDGVVIDEHPWPGDHRFVDADQIESIHEHAVVLKLGAAACQALPEPSANPAVVREDPADPATGAEGRLEDRLKRAWDRISGNY